ncbi:MAG: ribosome assembly factor SBDS [Candidatus Hodarchaeales archaeon]|jgi:ribosome maturation protein SDO1
MSINPEQKKVDFIKSKQALVKYKKQNFNFEIIVDPKAAFEYIQEFRNPSDDENLQIPDIIDILEIDIVYSDAHRGERATADDLTYIFETEDIIKIAKVILAEGSLQLTQAQRDELAEKKRRQIITFISKNAVDPKTNLPHPPTRIENALEHGKIKIDPFMSVDEQIKEVVKKLMVYLPIKIEQVVLAVRMPAEHGAKAYGVVKRFGQIRNEEWSSSGSWICVVSIPAGRQVDFMDSLERLTKGRAEIKVMERSKM